MKAATKLSSAERRARLSAGLSGLLLATPIWAVLLFFLLLPIAMIVAVSFWTATEFSFYPDFNISSWGLFSAVVVFHG